MRRYRAGLVAGFFCSDSQLSEFLKYGAAQMLDADEAFNRALKKAVWVQSALK